jgi:hypothetical protein
VAKVVTVDFEIGALETRMDEVDRAASAEVNRVVGPVVDAARRAWPVSGDDTPSRDLLSWSPAVEGIAVVRNTAPYATDIRRGETVRTLLDEPLEAAAAELGEAMPAIIARVLDG